MTETGMRLDVFASLHTPDRAKRPKYQRMADAMVEAIQLGVWRPGDKLPPEEELAELTPYSLGTVQRALRDLSEQGLVVRQHGLGSFVADTRRQLEDPWHCRFLGDDGETILPVYTTAIGREAVKNVSPWSSYLGADCDTMRLDRIVNVNHEFDIFSRFYADRALLRPLWELPLEELNGLNFKKMIIRECRLPITEVTNLVRLMKFDAEACERTNLPPGSSGLFVQAVACAGKDRCVYYQEFFIGPTRRPLQIPEMALV